MSDYISREAAIERLEKLFHLQATTARVIIEAIPAADVLENKRGKWIRGDMILNRQVCSICSARFDTLENDNFCPNCGAQMEKQT